MQNTQNFDTIKRKEQGISNVAIFSLVKERRYPANKSSNSMLQHTYNSLESQVVRLKKTSDNGTYLHNDTSSPSIMKCNVAMD